MQEVVARERLAFPFAAYLLEQHEQHAKNEKHDRDDVALSLKDTRSFFTSHALELGLRVEASVRLSGR